MAGEIQERLPVWHRNYHYLIAFYAVTGLTSLSYEVLWVRMLSLQFGVSVIAVVVTVTAFMSGLGIGSMAIAKWGKQLRRPIRMLAMLEGMIACYAILLPGLLRVANISIENAAAHLSLAQWEGVLSLTTVFLLMLPAMAMGAGFALILRAVGSETKWLAHVYGANTIGAAFGALLPLILLPNFGWAGAIRIVASVGLVAAVGIYWLATKNDESGFAVNEKIAKPAWVPMLAYASIGAASLMLEIAWTRLFGMVMLRTEYVLAIILSAFLLGIGTGSIAATRLRRREWFLVLPLIAGGFAVTSLWMLPALSAWVERSTPNTLVTAMLFQGGALLIITLPVTLVLGAWLPLLNTRLGGGGKWLYGANSLGGAVGVAAAGLIFIPVIGSTGTVVVAAMMLLAVGLIWSGYRWAWIAIPLMFTFAWPVMRMPEVAKLLPQAQAGSHNLHLYEDAISLTQVVEQKDGQRLLLTDLQRMDASTEPTAVMVQSNQARLPLLLHGDPHSVLFLGLGTGISISGSLSFPHLSRQAVELSQGAIDAAKLWFGPANKGAMEQTVVTRDDARHYLSATQEKFDVIIGDVFHPDLAGVSSLLSEQQFRRAKDRLDENGLFVQWLALNQFDTESLKVVFRTFRHVFPDAQMFLDGMHLALVGPNKKLNGAAALRRAAERFTPAQLEEATGGEGIWTWLGRYCGPVPESEGPTQDEWSPVIEYSLPRVRYSGQIDVVSVLSLVSRGRPELNEAGKMLGVRGEEKEQFERAYVATEFMMRSWLASLGGDDQESVHLMRLAYTANTGDRWLQYAMADRMYSTLGQARAMGMNEMRALKSILQVSPQHVESLRALWHLQRSEGDAEAGNTLHRLSLISPLDREIRAAANAGLQ